MKRHIIVEETALSYVLAHQSLLCCVYVVIGLLSRPWVDQLIARYLT